MICLYRIHRGIRVMSLDLFFLCPSVCYLDIGLYPAGMRKDVTFYACTIPSPSLNLPLAPSLGGDFSLLGSAVQHIRNPAILLLCLPFPVQPLYISPSYYSPSDSAVNAFLTILVCHYPSQITRLQKLFENFSLGGASVKTFQKLFSTPSGATLRSDRDSGLCLNRR